MGSHHDTTGPSAPDRSIPGVVRLLDARLNRRILDARTDLELNDRLREKTVIKRRLTAVPSADVDAYARAALTELEGARQ